MSELVPQARRLLEAARAAPPRPQSEARARMRASVVGASAAGALGAAGAAKPASVLQGLLAKLLVGAGTAAIGAGAVMTVAYVNAPRQPVTRHAVGQIAQVAPPVTPPVVEVPAVSGAVDAPPPTTPEASAAVAARKSEPTPAPQRPQPKAAAVQPAAVTASPVKPAEPARAPSLSEEVAALQQALAHVDAEHFDEALTVLDGYDARFPKGTLSLEARALRALTLCGLGRTDEARSVGAELLKSGTSPTLLRLRASCVAE